MDLYRRITPLDVDLAALQDTRVAIVGLGATGSHMAAQLGRLGADLHLIDRDVLEAHNLTSTALYTRSMVDAARAKADAAREAIEAINDDAVVTASIADVHAGTIDDLLSDADILLDGTDNMATRILLNEYALRENTPWIHVSALGAGGEVMPILPGATACFTCVFDDVDASRLASCETAGILPGAAATAASIAVSQLMALLDGRNEGGLYRFNLSHGTRRYDTVRRADCPVCSHGEYTQLSAAHAPVSTLCGEGSYQVRGPAQDLRSTAQALESQGTVTVNDHVLRFRADDTEFTVFGDGRAIIHADSAEAARSIYARFLGM